MKRLLVCLAAVLLAMSVFAKELPVVKYVDFKVYDPVYIGVEKGFFVSNGVKVELLGSVLAGPTAIQAVSAGKCHAGLSSIPAIINANAAGLPIYGVSDIQSALGKQPLEEYFVLKSSPIKTIADLKGKKFAVNLWKSSFHYTALMMLDKNWLKPEDVNFILLSFDKQVQAIDAGEVEIVGLMEPYASYLKAKGNYRVLFNAFDVFGKKQFTLHFVNRVWAEHNPEQAKAFVSGIVESINWMKKNPAETKRIIAKYTKIDEKFIPDYEFQENGKVVNDDVKFWLDYLLKAGDIKATWLTPDEIAGNVYNKYVK